MLLCSASGSGSTSCSASGSGSTRLPSVLVCSASGSGSATSLLICSGSGSGSTTLAAIGSASGSGSTTLVAIGSASGSGSAAPAVSSSIASLEPGQGGSGSGIGGSRVTNGSRTPKQIASCFAMLNEAMAHAE